MSGTVAAVAQLAGTLLAAPITRTSTGEAVAFWTLGPLALICAVAMILSRNAVHAALLLVVVMFSLAGFYALQSAPFLAAVEIIVYAGAIMILFLFVLMLVGVDSSDSLVETLRGHRVASLTLTAGLVALLTGAIGHAVAGRGAVGLDEVNNAAGRGNVKAIARLLFTDYVFPFEVVSALLITAAIGAMVLGHRERTEPRPGQRELMKRRFGEFAASGAHPGSLPGPGVFATQDDATQRALLPSGAPDEESVMPEYAGGTSSRDSHPRYSSPGEDVAVGEAEGVPS